MIEGISLILFMIVSLVFWSENNDKHKKTLRQCDRLEKIIRGYMREQVKGE